MYQGTLKRVTKCLVVNDLYFAFSCDNGDMSQIVDTSSEEDFVNGHTNGMNGKSAPFMHELTDYYKEFEKLHLVS